MCGIAGRFHQVTLPLDPQWQGRADALLAHRGPDGSGHFIDANCELVHRRLALIDLSATGRQPLANEDGSVQVVCNGEIYNHQELRAELRARGHRFRGTSDTEVLVHLYEEHGAGMLSRLRGMFAFALYDQRRTLLMLARDRFGIKPLYHARHDGQFVFASEIKALLALEGFRPELDRQACYDFLGLTYIPEPATGFANIFALPKGTSLIVGRDDDETPPRPFHQVRAAPRVSGSLPEMAERVGASLLDAVSRQSVADVPVAALLSGGIDSSLVVAAYTRATKQPPATFNVRFPDKGYDETSYAVAVAEHCGTHHRTIDIDAGTLAPESVIELLEHFDQPFADTSLIPMYSVARAIREQGIICALSGDGGDEVFGGYGRFWRANQFIRLMGLPRLAQQAVKGVGHLLAVRTPNLGRQLIKAVRLAQAGERDSSVLIAGLSNYLNEEQKRELLLPNAGQLRTVYRHFDGFEPRGVCDLEELSRRLTENLLAVALPGDMLRKVDMMSMRAGIEVRVPMLDEAVAEHGLSLPHRMKTDGRRGKLVLRELARQWLPAPVAHHRKQGFGIPLDRLLSGRFHQLLNDLLLSPSARIGAFLDINIVGEWLRLFERARHGSHQNAISREGLYQRIFIALALELWLRRHNLSW